MRLSVRVVVSLALFAGCEATPPSGSSASWNDAKSRPQLLAGPLFDGPDDLEATARALLERRAAEFHLDAPGSSLVLTTTRVGLSGTYLRFAQQQRVGDATLPVFEGEVIVLVRDTGDRREVRAVNLEHLDEAATAKDEGDLGAALAIAHVQATAPDAGEPLATRGIFVTKQGLARVAWQVKLSTQAPPHDWTVYVDAATGHELARRDGVRFIDGTAYVFDMNPVASTGDRTLVDGSGATTPALDAARFLVTLPRLDGSGFTRGLFANTRPRTLGRVNSSTNDFLFARDALGFEQANVYFHLDRTQARIQSLGFMNVNNRVQEAIVDSQNADNSYYSSTDLRLNFGTGGVDDAEDGDIVCHEYGHSIQDNQVPGFGGGDEGAMGEGFSDYLAASFALSLTADAGHPQRGDPACVGEWDSSSYSTQTPKCLRRVDGTKHWPEADENGVHANGEVWSAGLWDVRSALGGEVTDRLVLESHFLLGQSSSFFTASQALITADLNLNAGVNADTLRRKLIKYGLTRTLTAPAAPAPFTSIPVAVGPRRDAAGNYAANTDEVNTLTVPGATALRVHFTRVELETNNQCLSNSCDNLYLTNAAGDLFQVVMGLQSNLTSVAVVGDTVNLRLVSDPSQQRFGYHVDRVDALGVMGDAGVLFDGGLDVVDAGAPPPPPFDAGPPPVPPDAGTRDAGVVPIGADAGTATDAGVRFTRTLPAVGVERLSPALTRGCGCGATTGLEAWAALALLGALARRRHPPR